MRRSRPPKTFTKSPPMIIQTPDWKNNRARQKFDEDGLPWLAGRTRVSWELASPIILLRGLLLAANSFGSVYLTTSFRQIQQ